MLKGLFRLIKYLFPRRPFHKPRNAVISPYPAKELDMYRDDLTYLVRLGVTRSREHSAVLMKRYRAKTADELLARLPPRRRRNRFYDLILRIDGHDARDMYKPRKSQSIRVDYIFGDTNGND